jgi:hypothetical protein
MSGVVVPTIGEVLVAISDVVVAESELVDVARVSSEMERAGVLATQQ